MSLIALKLSRREDSSSRPWPSIESTTALYDPIHGSDRRCKADKLEQNEAGIQWVRSDGSEVASLMATGRTDVQSFTSEYEIFGGALAQIFLEPILDKVNLIFDETVESHEQHGDKVTVAFAKSKRVESFDLLVGADGYFSKIRGTMLGAKPSEQVHSEGTHVAFFTVKRDLLNGSRLAKMHSTTGGRACFVRPDLHPDGRCRAMFMNMTLPEDTETKARLDNALRAGDEAYKQLMQEMYADAGWLAPEILKGMWESDDFYCSTMGQTRSPKLQDGRVVLLGDAGYTLPGLGTSLAIMGGYCLAGELLRSGGDVAVAAKRYEEIFLPFVQKQQHDDLVWPMRLLMPQTEWGIRIRDVMLSFVMWSGVVQMGMRVSAWLGFSEAKLALPEYPWPVEEKNQVRSMTAG